MAVVRFAYLCFRVVGTASDFSRPGNTFLHKVVLFFVSGGVVPVFFRGVFFVIECFAIKCGLVILITV